MGGEQITDMKCRGGNITLSGNWDTSLEQYYSRVDIIVELETGERDIMFLDGYDIEEVLRAFVKAYAQQYTTTYIEDGEFEEIIQAFNSLLKEKLWGDKS